MTGFIRKNKYCSRCGKVIDPYSYVISDGKIFCRECDDEYLL